ncbi:MAG: GNAT family N-acetyltransferase [Segetibacter sp.]
MLTVVTSPFPGLISQRLKLRQVSPEDANEVFFLRSDKRVMEFLDRQPAKSIEDAQEFIEKLKDLEDKQDAVTWAITLKEDVKLIGTICYWNILKEHYRAEIGYVLHPDFQGKGIMHEAFSTVLEYGFKTMHLHSVEANVNPNNHASIKLLEKNNFKREGYFKENYYFNGKFLDSAIYSLLALDYNK